MLGHKSHTCLALLQLARYRYVLVRQLECFGATAAYRHQPTRGQEVLAHAFAHDFSLRIRLEVGEWEISMCVNLLERQRPL